MRVKTLTPNLVVMGDRLVDQTTEFNLGPPEKHKGPLCIEVTLRDKDDLSNLKKYLDKLLGDLPLPEKKAKKGSLPEMDVEPIKEMLEEIKVKCKTQDEVIKYLRERNFKFVTAQFLEDRDIKVDINAKVPDDYQFMIRLLKEGKDPKADKYDPQLLMGFKFLGETKGKFIRPYLYGRKEEVINLPWAKKSDINFKKVAAIKYPHYMNQEERDKYSLELRKMKLNPELKPSKFFLRWKEPVDQINK